MAGDSAGGALTLSTLVNLRDSRDPMPAAGVCLSPWCDLEANSGSMLNNAKFDYVNQRAVRHYAKYFIDPKDLRNPLAAPVHADLHGLPPLLIQVGGAEALLDDAVRVAQRARDAGVTVELDVWPDMIHVWQLFAFLSPVGTQAIEKIGRYVIARTGGSTRDAA